MVIDELGKLVQAMTGRAAPSWIKLAAKSLLELYPRSAPHSEWTGKLRAGDETDRVAEPIMSPTLSFIGVSTPAGFFEGMTETTLEDGTLNRLTVFVGGRPGARQKDPARLTPPAALVERIKTAYEAAGPTGNLAGDRSRDAYAPQPMRFVPWADSAAEAAIEAIEAWEDDARDAGRGGVCGRAAEQTQKIATIRALARNATAPAITAEDVAWAWGIVRASIAEIERGAADNMAGSEFETALKKIERAVLAAGPDGVARSVLKRRKGISQYEDRIFDAVVRRLVETSVIFDPKNVSGLGPTQPPSRLIAMVHHGM
jgi:hypothetical protein